MLILKSAAINTVTLTLCLFGPNTTANEVVNPRKYCSANQSIHKGPSQTHDAPQRADAVATIDLPDKCSLACSTIKDNNLPSK
jgi:hypothetical protein